MSEESKTTGGQHSKPAIAEMEGSLNQLKELRVSAEEHLRAIEVARKKADDDALYASQITAATEDNSKAIATLKGQAESDFQAFSGNRQKYSDELNPALADLQRVMGEIAQVRVNVEGHLRATETARKKADDDASYASQAKNNTEEHAKAVASFKGQAEAEFNSITANKQKSDELLAAVTLGKATVDADIQAISGRRKESDTASQEIVRASEAGVARLQEIDQAKSSADASLKAANESTNAAARAQGLAESAQKTIVTLSTKSQELGLKIVAINEACEVASTDIDSILTEVKSKEEEIGVIIQRLTKSDRIATDYADRLTELSEQSEALRKSVEDLLPGATSAGLASAFNAQKNRFSLPQTRWLWTFVICISLLVIISIPSFYRAAFGTVASSWGEIFRGFAMRLPVVIPLVWLAIYAGRNYMLSLRLEEEYAYKEAVSAAFEGYKREMASITAGDATNPTPLTTLCTDVLRALAERPGRIYEGRYKDITPLNVAHEAGKEILETFSKQEVAEE